jgi:hypothetical protein
VRTKFEANGWPLRIGASKKQAVDKAARGRVCLVPKLGSRYAWGCLSLTALKLPSLVCFLALNFAEPRVQVHVVWLVFAQGIPSNPSQTTSSPIQHHWLLHLRSLALRLVSGHQKLQALRPKLADDGPAGF